MTTWIIVFGTPVRDDGSPSGTLQRRVRAAYDFGRTRAHPTYLVTGGQRKGPVPEWQAMRELLLSYGVSDDAIVPEKAGLDTLGQIRVCTTVLKGDARGAEIWFSTSRYHRMRCRWLLGLCGIRARAVPALPDRPDVPWLQLALAWLHEAIATPYDVALALTGRVIGRR